MTNKICDGCETVAHCMKNGCISKLDTLAMAREAGIDVDTAWGVANAALERFAALIASRVAAAAKAEEREACALLSEEYVCGNRASIEQDFIAESIAADIRARSGDKK